MRAIAEHVRRDITSWRRPQWHLGAASTFGVVNKLIGDSPAFSTFALRTHRPSSESMAIRIVVHDAVPAGARKHPALWR
jgi:hypothetical protein